MADVDPAPAVAPSRHGHGGMDLTQGPILRTLLAFALPTLGANILQSLNGSINAIWVGRFLGETALAATANANIIMFLMFSAGFGFSMATTILIAQNIGRRNIDGARRAFGTGFGLFSIVSVAIAATGWIGAPALLRLLGTPPDAAPLALAYLRVIFLGMPPIFLFVLVTMGLRSVGDSMTPFRFMILTVALDMALNPVFILGLGPAPRLGIAGAATATLVANLAALVLIVVRVYRRDLAIRLRGPELRYLRPDPALLRVIGVKGLPMGLQMVMMSVSGLVLVGLVNRLGVDSAAAYGVSQQLWSYVQMPALAINAAVSAMAAQNIGADRWDRVGRIAGAGLTINVALTGAIVTALALFDEPIITLFLGRASPAVPIAEHILAVGGWSFILFGLAMVFFAVVRANGAVVGPLIILAIGLLGTRIVFAFSLMPSIGAEALWWSYPVSAAVLLVMAALYYRAGGWKKVRLLDQVEEEEARERACADAEPAGRMNPSA